MEIDYLMVIVNSPARRMGTTSRTKQQAAARLQDGAGGGDSAVLDGLPAVAIHAPPPDTAALPGQRNGGGRQRTQVRAGPAADRGSEEGASNSYQTHRAKAVRAYSAGKAHGRRNGEWLWRLLGYKRGAGGCCKPAMAERESVCVCLYK